MGRRFLVGAATAFLLLLLGLRLEARMPDEGGMGEETVSFHGVCVYRQEIARADAGRHSPYPALAVAGLVVALGSISAGGAAVLLRRGCKHASPGTT